MAKETSNPTHTPLFLGLNPGDAVCGRHGGMERNHSPVVEVDERRYAARDGVALYACPECCIDLFALAGEPNVDPNRAATLLWKQYLRDDWAGNIERLFVEIGANRAGTQGRRTVVSSENNPSESNSERSPLP